MKKGTSMAWAQWAEVEDEALGKVRIPRGHNLGVALIDKVNGKAKLVLWRRFGGVAC
jgi:hypothetical protein